MVTPVFHLGTVSTFGTTSILKCNALFSWPPAALLFRPFKLINLVGCVLLFEPQQCWRLTLVDSFLVALLFPRSVSRVKFLPCSVSRVKSCLRPRQSSLLSRCRCQLQPQQRWRLTLVASFKVALLLPRSVSRVKFLPCSVSRVKPCFRPWQLSLLSRR